LLNRMLIYTKSTKTWKTEILLPSGHRGKFYAYN